MGDFATVNAVYAEAFGDHKPARSTVQVSELVADRPQERVAKKTLRIALVGVGAAAQTAFACILISSVLWR